MDLGEQRHHAVDAPGENGGGKPRPSEGRRPPKSRASSLALLLAGASVLVRALIEISAARRLPSPSAPLSSSSGAADTPSPKPHRPSERRSSRCVVPPDMRDEGLVIFWHVAKAGGTTVRNLFRQKFDSTTVYQRAKFFDRLPAMRGYLMGEPPSSREKPGRRTRMFVEVHDGPNPTLFEAARALRDLRGEAARRGVPFFVFTVLRDPVDYMVSFFNYQNVYGTRRYERANATEEDFRRVSLPSPQVSRLFLAKRDYRLYFIRRAVDACSLTDAPRPPISACSSPGGSCRPRGTTASSGGTSRIPSAQTPTS